RNDAELFYTIVGTSGDYVLVLSGGPGEDIRSMQRVADELGKKYRCIMWEQRGTGRSKLPKYDSSTINLNAYLEDIEALRKQLHAGKFIVVGNSWGMILGLAYAGTNPDATRGVITIGSGPITFEYLGVFSDNQFSRLGACELEMRDFWKDPAGEANIYEAHGLIKNSILAFIDKCGHMPWLEQPEQTWKIVNNFLAHLPSDL